MPIYIAAAVTIQAVFRGFWARDCLNVDLFCATAIQRIFRGYVCRMNFHYDRYRIVKVQSVWRKCIARERVAYLLAYAILIQSTARGFIARRATEDLYWRRSQEIGDISATRIQSAWRMHFCWVRYNELLCALIIQCVVRGWRARKLAASMRAARDAQIKSRSRRAAAASWSVRNPSRSIASVDYRNTQSSSRSASYQPPSRTSSQDSRRSQVVRMENGHRTVPNNLGTRDVRNNNISKATIGRAPFQESAALSRKLNSSYKVEGSSSNHRVVAVHQFELDGEEEDRAAPHSSSLPQQSRDVNSNMDRMRHPSAEGKHTPTSIHQHSQAQGFQTNRMPSRLTNDKSRVSGDEKSWEGCRVYDDGEPSQRTHYKGAVNYGPAQDRPVVARNWSEETQSAPGAIPVAQYTNFVDTRGDGFDWAYTVWYEKGLIQWLPAPRNKKDNGNF